MHMLIYSKTENFFFTFLKYFHLYAEQKMLIDFDHFPSSLEWAAVLIVLHLINP